MSKYVLEQEKCLGEEAEARQAFIPGLKLYGYCQGIFGRDSYNTKTIKEINGNVIVVINAQGYYESAEVESWVDLLKSSNGSLNDESDEIYRN